MAQWKLTMLAVLAVATLSVADDQEKKIKRSDLPPAVEKTVAAISQGAAIKALALMMSSGLGLGAMACAAGPPLARKTMTRMTPLRMRTVLFSAR